MKNTALSLLIFFPILLFASQAERYNLGQYFSQIESHIHQTDFFSDKCSSLNGIDKKLFLFESRQIQKFPQKRRINLANDSFELRLFIKDKVDFFTRRKKISKNCWNELRKIVFALRNLEDALIYNQVQAINRFENKKFIFKGLDDLISGDIIISLHQDYSSQSIAKIGKQISNFSHASMVYKDDDGNPFVVEAIGEIGAWVLPLNKLMNKEQTILILRHKDYLLASRAATIIYNKVNKFQKKYKNIQYDFKMDYKDPKRLFCTEIIHHGFQLASDREIDISPYKTTFNKGLIPFLKKFGLNIKEDNIETFNTLGPGDLEWSPEFDILAEWTNTSGIKDTHMKSAILEKMFEWIEVYNYQFKKTKFINLAPKIAKTLRRIPYYSVKERRIKNLFEGTFSKNIKSAQISMFLMVDFIGSKLTKELNKKDFNKKNLTPYIELKKKLEHIRLADYNLFQKYKKQKRKRNKPHFHLHFRPRKQKDERKNLN